MYHWQVLASPNVKLFNATVMEDLIIREDAASGKPRVGGVVTNWTIVALNHHTQVLLLVSTCSSSASESTIPVSVSHLLFGSKLSKTFGRLQRELCLRCSPVPDCVRAPRGRGRAAWTPT